MGRRSTTAKFGLLATGGRMQQTGGPLVGVDVTFNRRFVMPAVD